MTEQRVLIRDFVIHRYLRQVKPNWSTADAALVENRYWAFRKANPAVVDPEQWATHLNHPEFPSRLDRLVGEFRKWLEGPHEH